jgi:hypothetical protein
LIRFYLLAYSLSALFVKSPFAKATEDFDFEVAISIYIDIVERGCGKMGR